MFKTVRTSGVRPRGCCFITVVQTRPSCGEIVTAMRKDDKDTVRLDKWLWAARFFKTRSMAHDAIEGGKVYVDNIRAKPSRSVSVGDEIMVTTPRGRFEITVEAVSSQRGSPSIAAKLYREKDESKKQREDLAEMHRLARNAAPEERPNSQDRKLLRRIIEQLD